MKDGVGNECADFVLDWRDGVGQIAERILGILAFPELLDRFIAQSSYHFPAVLLVREEAQYIRERRISLLDERKE